MGALKVILWQELVLFKRKFWGITTGAMISPMLYLIVFGWGLGDGMQVEGQDYLTFVIPGIVAMTTMVVSYNNLANNINISRIYEKTFESFMVAPIKMHVYALAKILGGALRGMYSGALIILIVSVFGTKLAVTPYFIFVMFLNCMVFSSIGFTVGLIINSHMEMSKFSNFVITPMSFLCGTFFSLGKMPMIVKGLIMVLPLTHTSIALRSTGENLMSDMIHPAILIAYFIVMFSVGVRKCLKAE
ncbi:ABC-2 type transporter [Dethiosulfatibacter aminovorans DSM 17477]|uniref:Transport permease protein n=2 Tax=Dethiosulfatibacter TaxID=448125 RepID=A0A1M6LX24_9FIRM|nr:ABC-2 type transporter [Dethiosulfatibacter aminovorans DSM 17477]